MPLQGKLSSLALFIWLTLALDLILNVQVLFNEKENTTIGYSGLVLLSPIVYFYYYKLKGKSLIDT